MNQCTWLFQYGHKRTKHITITNTNEINFDDKAWREKFDKKISELKRQKMQLENQIEVYEAVFDELLKEKDPKEIDLKLRRSPRMKEVQIQSIRTFNRMF